MNRSRNARRAVYGALLICTIVTFAGTAALLQFSVYPLFAAQDSFEAQSRTLSELQQKTNIRQQLSDELEMVEPHRDAIERAFVQQEDLPAFFEHLEKRAAATRNAYQLQDTEELQRGGMNVLSLPIRLQGTYPDLVLFLREVRALPYVVSIRSVVVDGLGDGTVRSTVILEAFLKEV